MTGDHLKGGHLAHFFVLSRCVSIAAVQELQTQKIIDHWIHNRKMRPLSLSMRFVPLPNSLVQNLGVHRQ